MDNIKHLLVDASAVFFHYYFGMPDHWFSKEGEATAAVYGFASRLSRWLTQYQPARVAVCFDESLQTGFRHKIDPNYKANRAMADDNIRFQLAACKELCGLLGVPFFASQHYEADDLMASLARTLRRSQTAIVIASRDKDMTQLLLRPQDCLWDFTTDKQLTSDAVYQRWQVRPTQMADFLALVGDASDNIMGVPGIGAKTASQLLSHFGSIDSMLENIDQIASIDIRGARTLSAKVQTHRESLLMAQQLTTLVDDVELVTGVRDLNRQALKAEKIKPFCHRMGFGKLARTLSTC